MKYQNSIPVIPPPRKIPIIPAKILEAYKYWHQISRHIPKTLRYSLGIKIDSLFVEVLELASSAQFTLKEERIRLIGRAITKNDTLKYMLHVLLELSGITENDFVASSLMLEEAGRMLYGWYNKMINENRSQKERKQE